MNTFLGMLSSVRNIVLILMIVGLLVFTFMGITDGKDFISALLIIIGFFFGSKSGIAPENTTTETITKTTPVV